MSIEYEVLAPIGKLEYLIPVIESGANAVYVGLKGFSSRPSNVDLTFCEIEEALRITKVKNIKLFVAVNACVGHENIKELMDNLVKLDAIGVDAIIISDYGVLYLASKIIKNAEIHASTLLGVYNAETVRHLKQLGVKRVVFSTNLYFDEIISIIEEVPEMDYEIIAMGGICFNDNRQCRLPHSNDAKKYKVFCSEKYDVYLNDECLGKAKSIKAPKINLYDTVGLYMAAGIKSYKIEGRTGTKEDIQNTTKALRRSIKAALIKKELFGGFTHYFSKYRSSVNNLL